MSAVSRLEGEEWAGWEMEGMDGAAGCWISRPGGFPFITISHTSLGSSSN